MLRNRWPDQIGMGGQMLSDSVAEYQRNAQPKGTWLILDPSKTRLRTCTMGGRQVTCIRIEEGV